MYHARLVRLLHLRDSFAPRSSRSPASPIGLLVGNAAAPGRGCDAGQDENSLSARTSFGHLSPGASEANKTIPKQLPAASRLQKLGLIICTGNMWSPEICRAQNHCSVDSNGCYPLAATYFWRPHIACVFS